MALQVRLFTLGVWNKFKLEDQFSTVGIMAHKALPCTDTCLCGHVIHSVLDENWRILEFGSVQIAPQVWMPVYNSVSVLWLMETIPLSMCHAAQPRGLLSFPQLFLSPVCEHNMEKLGLCNNSLILLCIFNVCLSLNKISNHALIILIIP